MDCLPKPFFINRFLIKDNNHFINKSILLKKYICENDFDLSNNKMKYGYVDIGEKNPSLIFYKENGDFKYIIPIAKLNLRELEIYFESTELGYLKIYKIPNTIFNEKFYQNIDNPDLENNMIKTLIIKYLEKTKHTRLVFHK